MIGLDGMEIVYCSVCGHRIPESDFRKGKAVTVLKRHYCKDCASQVVKESSEGSSHNPTETPKQFRIRTQRTPMADPVKPGSPKIPYLIAAAVGLVALALLLFVLFGK